MSLTPLTEAVDERTFGGKARRLATALRGGLHVPDGIALSVSLVDAVGNGEARAIERVERAAVRLPAAVAVRSSAAGEDSAAASFAGQHLSCLNVRSPSEVVAAVARVSRSGRSPGALAYRERLDIATGPQLGVVVQAFVDADSAGVMFTRHPRGSADERLIEATWGLGGTVTAGRVIPDRYRLSPTGDVLERAPGSKRVALRAAPDGGTVEEPLEGDLATRGCLGDRALRDLAELAARCEALFGEPQDIEWAFADEALHLLQSRPITLRAAAAAQ